MKVLIVDDDPNTVQMIEDSIPWEEYGISEIFAAYHGQMAMEIIGKEEPDIVISDIEMPQMDGHHLTKLIKESDQFCHIPVVIFSSLINEEMRRKGESLGADAQLSKPEIGQLVAALDNLIGVTDHQ